MAGALLVTDQHVPKLPSRTAGRDGKHRPTGDTEDQLDAEFLQERTTASAPVIWTGAACRPVLLPDA